MGFEFSSGPDSITVANSGTAVFSVTTAGVPILGGPMIAFQWYEDGFWMDGPQALTGETASSLSFITGLDDNDKEYFVKVNDKYTSRRAKLTISTENPTVTRDIKETYVLPETLSVLYSKDPLPFQFAVTEAISGDSRFEWSKNGITVGEDSQVYRFLPTYQEDNNAIVKCKIFDEMDPNFSSTGPCKITVIPNPPRITQNPLDKDSFAGDTVRFTVTAEDSTEDLKYQWYSISGATSTMLAGSSGTFVDVSVTSGSDEDEYYCIVTNIVQSSADRITYGDANLDGVVDGTDLTTLISWVTGTGAPKIGTKAFVSVDLNGDGELTSADIDSLAAIVSGGASSALEATRHTTISNKGKINVLDDSLDISVDLIGENSIGIFQNGSSSVLEINGQDLLDQEAGIFKSHKFNLVGSESDIQGLSQFVDEKGIDELNRFLKQVKPVYTELNDGGLIMNLDIREGEGSSSSSDTSAGIGVEYIVYDAEDALDLDAEIYTQYDGLTKYNQTKVTLPEHIDFWMEEVPPNEKTKYVFANETSGTANYINKIDGLFNAD